jgi:hypothetical protein
MENDSDYEDANLEVEQKKTPKGQKNKDQRRLIVILEHAYIFNNKGI